MKGKKKEVVLVVSNFSGMTKKGNIMMKKPTVPMASGSIKKAKVSIKKGKCFYYKKIGQ